MKPNTFWGRLWVICGLGVGLSACGMPPVASVPPQERAAIEAQMMRDISALASDEFEGRKPGTPGGARTISYLIDRMGEVGLQSGTNDPGSAWRAPVELVSSRPSSSSITLKVGNREAELDETEAYAFSTASQVLLDGVETLFVGFGNSDIAAEDLAGKVVVMLGEPGFSPARRAALFEAAPAAIITVVQDSIALRSVRLANSGERVMLEVEDDRRLAGFVVESVMIEALGEDAWQDLRGLADADDFIPIPLELNAAIDATSQRRAFTSYNVVGMLPGAVRGSGSVLLLAHWDHLGECAPGAPDPICNGAIDNASGIALMLELSRRLAVSGPHDRDIYVLATSAEESGLLGARAFAQGPPIPLDNYVAAFNFDSVTLAPAGAPVGFIGEGLTDLDTIILETLDDAGRQLGNRDYAESFVRRQDGWSLLERGVPAVMLSTAFSSEIVLGPFLTGDYHRPTDEPGMLEMGGAVDDLLLHEELVKRIASTERYTPPPAQ